MTSKRNIKKVLAFLESSKIRSLKGHEKSELWRFLATVNGSFPFLPRPTIIPPPLPVEAVAAATSVHVFIHWIQ